MYIHFVIRDDDFAVNKLKYRTMNGEEKEIGKLNPLTFPTALYL